MCKRHPCDDPELIPGVVCTNCTCDEVFGNITLHLISDNKYCTSCNQLDLNGTCQELGFCDNKTCGSSPKCIGSCGECTNDGEYCVDGHCQAVTYLGSCANPIPLINNASAIYDGVITVYGSINNTQYLNLVSPRCNVNQAVSIIYSFHLPVRSAYTIRVQSASGDSNSLDTVLEVLNGDCSVLPYPVSETCSDDNTPPGGVGSGVSGTLPPGDYSFLVTGYEVKVEGEFVITAAFFSDQCIPNCNSLYCGITPCKFANGQAFDCFMGPNSSFVGACKDDQVCRSGQCVNITCTPQCEGKVCGDDGCGGSCGNCTGEGEFCLKEIGTCKVFGGCDHLLPYCSQKCTKTQYCGSDCLCHGTHDEFTDLAVGHQDLVDSLIIETVFFTNVSCPLSPDEGPCIDEAGNRTLLRLTTTVINIGSKGFIPPQPSEDYPNLFQFSDCHRHYHFKDFALFYLVDPATGYVVKNGEKRAYCLSDSTKRLTAPWVPCLGVYGCSEQGLQPGWSDDYQNILDCQWIDITTVPPGTYELYVFANPVRVFNENSYDNQGQRVLVSIPSISSRSETQKVRILKELGRVPSNFFFEKNNNLLKK